MVDASSVRVNAVTSEMNPTMLWHHRLGHMSEKGMDMLVARGKLTGLKKVENVLYEPCILVKQKRVYDINSSRTAEN